ncbi:MAG: hypothetical protein KatS3mg076_1392 [Candidatus Binatia bacterium]|nr:MAG: hypothetical protein KatS3mg076_1392 [Candidatus Binatia bacterium]
MVPPRASSPRELRLFRVLLGFVLALEFLRPTTARTETSAELRARGLVHFRAKEFARALEWFDRAVRADPNDPYALYSRGVALSRLRRYEEALGDLERALALDPTISEAALEAGVAALELGRYRDALRWLEKARRDPELRGEASMFSGIAHLRLGEVEEAEEDFRLAEEADPELEVPAAYYRGVSAFRQKLWAEAEGFFRKVEESAPTTPMAAEARVFLRELRARKRTRYGIYGGVDFQYDSNVALAPDDEVVKQDLGLAEEADGRVALTLGGWYALWRSRGAELEASYEFYQTLHFDLTDFDLQNHRPSLLARARWEWLEFVFATRYDFFLLRTDEFLHEVNVVPAVVFRQGKLGRTEVSYRLRRRDFVLEPFDSLRDAFNHAAGVRQVFFLGRPDRYAWLGYQFDDEQPSRDTVAAEAFGYLGHQAGAGFLAALPWGLGLEGRYFYRREDYARESRRPESNFERRQDDEHRAIVSVWKRLGPWFRLSASYFGTWNLSNDRAFEYERHIASFGVEGRY